MLFYIFFKYIIFIKYHKKFCAQCSALRSRPICFDFIYSVKLNLSKVSPPKKNIWKVETERLIMESDNMFRRLW